MKRLPVLGCDCSGHFGACYGSQCEGRWGNARCGSRRNGWRGRRSGERREGWFSYQRNRAAVGRETQARTQYESTAEYQNAPHSNFNEAPPEVLGTTASGTAKKAGEEAVIRKDGKPIVGITFPSDWNQKTGDNYISAVSGDGRSLLDAGHPRWRS